MNAPVGTAFVIRFLQHRATEANNITIIPTVIVSIPRWLIKLLLRHSKHDISTNVWPMLGHSRRRWPNIGATLGRCLRFAGRPLLTFVSYGRRTNVDSRTMIVPTPSGVSIRWWWGDSKVFIRIKINFANFVKQFCELMWRRTKAKKWEMKIRTNLLVVRTL